MAWNDTPPTKAELETNSDWAKTPPTPKELGMPNVSALESLLRGGVNQFGLAPAVVGAGEAGLDKLSGSNKSLMDLYNQHREESLKNFKDAETANPKTYMAGNVAGSLALTPLMPEAPAGALGGALMGAGFGAASGAGQALSEGKDLGDIAKSAAIQAAPGALVGGSIGALANKFIPKNLEAAANQNAVEALNPSNPQIKNLLKAPTVAGGTNRLQEVGSVLNNPSEFLDGKSVITATGNASDHLENLLQAQQNSGKFLGTVAEQVDSSGQKLVDTAPIIKKIEELQKPYLGVDPDSIESGLPKQSFPEEFNVLNKLKSDIAAYGDQPISFTQAEAIKKDISSLAYKDNGKISNQDMAQLRGFVNDNIETALDTATKNMNDPALFQKYIDAKNLYGATKQVQQSAEGNVAKGISNKDIGITDYMAGGAGALSGGSIGALASLGLKKTLESKGNQLLAKTQQGIVNKLSNAPQATADSMKKITTSMTGWSPEQYAQVASKFRESADPTIQKLGNVFDSMSNKDTMGRNALIFSIMQVPTYREIMRSVSGN